MMPLRANTTLPNLVLAQRVIDKMTNAVSEFVEDETGEAMIGLILPGTNTNGVPTIYVLDTISPDDTALRMYHTFQQGDERQDELIWWLQENWRVEREKSGRGFGAGQKNNKWDAPLRYLCDWHKQPGYMIAPSGGDLATALDWLDDQENETDALLVPIVTLGHPATTDGSMANVNFVVAPMGDGTFLRVDWWYIHKRVGLFQPMNPVLYPDNQLPKLTEYPWHLVDQERAQQEFGKIQDEQIALSVLYRDVDGKKPLDICLLVARQWSDKMLILTTQWDYPKSRPKAWIAPCVPLAEGEIIQDIFDDLWKKATPVKDPSGWKWTADSYLIDYIHAVEDALGISRPDPEPDAPETTALDETDAMTEQES
jgi:hypothetical protein